MNLGKRPAVAPACAYLLANIEHGSFVALAFADHDGPAHGHGVHAFAHRFGGDFICFMAVPQTHGIGGTRRPLFPTPNKIHPHRLPHTCPSLLSSAFFSPPS